MEEQSVGFVEHAIRNDSESQNWPDPITNLGRDETKSAKHSVRGVKPQLSINRLSVA
jgi:hypothetical protein